MHELVIAVDPGREKCGIAVVHQHKGVLCQQVINTRTLAEVVQSLAVAHGTNTVVIGDRTSSSDAKRKIEQGVSNGQRLTIIPIDEHRSTDAARQRYWRENPPRGLMRFIPVTLQTPPVPVDDYVAVILAERYFQCPDIEMSATKQE